MSHRLLVTDTLAESGLAILRKADDVELDYRPGLKGDDLLRAVRESDALITRSGTAVTPELVNAGSRRAAGARAFEMRVIANDPYIPPTVFEKAGAERVSLDELLARADVITVHTPLTDETRGMLGAAEIAKMKDGVLGLNIARGGIWEETALAEALASGKAAGAAIDVYVNEPPGKDHPLVRSNNVILSPHIG